MPIGCYSLTPYVADALWKRRPATVLDLGAGMGFYGAVVRQWCDMGVRPWRTHLEGVEGFAGYRGPCWNLYDEMHVGPIGAFLEARPAQTWDAILLLDVIEHFADRDGEALLTDLRGRLRPGGILLIGTPAIWQEQGAAHGNAYECHRSLWPAERLAAAGYNVLCDGQPDQWGNSMALAAMFAFRRA